MKTIQTWKIGDAMNLIKDIPSNTVDLLITDPPFSTPIVSGFGRKVVRNLGDISVQTFYFTSMKKEFERILKHNGRVFIFCDDRFYPILFAAFYEWQNKQLIIWDKGRIGLGNPIRKKHELIFYVNRNSFTPNKNLKITHYPSILKFDSEKNKVHGAEKPIKLVKHLIWGFSDEGDTVFDPFLGSGTTLQACKELNRNGVGFEINPKYEEMIIKRMTTGDGGNIK